MPLGQKKKHKKTQKQYCKKFNKDLKKNGPHQKKNLQKKRSLQITNAGEGWRKGNPPTLLVGM